MANVVVTLSGDERRLLTSLDNVIKKEDKLRRKARAVGEAGKAAGKATGDAFKGKGAHGLFTGPLVDAKAMVAGLGTVAAAVGAITSAYEVMIKNSREAAAEVGKASKDILSFAALQPAGTKEQRVQQAAAVAANAGITDRGVAFDTIQSLQSAPGSNFRKGLRASETVFRAFRLGVPLESAKEGEAIGISQGANPGDFTRFAFEAGQMSSSSPAVVTTAAPGLTFFKDKRLGFAIAGVIAGGVRAGEVPTFTKAAGIGLSNTGGLGKFFREQGLAKAGGLEKLRALKRAGLTTPDALKAAGLASIRQQQAIATVVNNIPQVERIRNAIIRKATPGFLGRQLGQLEKEIPSERVKRQNDILLAKLKDAQGLTAAGRAEQRQRRLELSRGLAFRRSGIESILNFDLIDEEGRTSGFRQFLFNLFGTTSAQATVSTNRQLIERELQKSNPSSAGKALGEAAEQLKESLHPPALSPATEDN